MPPDHRVDQRRVNSAQADMGGRSGGDTPGERPAVAVEHRQRPQIDRLLVEPEGYDVSERVQICAAVVIDYALRVAGRARGVVQRDRLPLVARPPPTKLGIAAGNEVLVLDRAEPRRAGRVLGDGI